MATENELLVLAGAGALAIYAGKKSNEAQKEIERERR